MRPDLAQDGHPDWLRPDWPVRDNVQALSTTRAGGHSLPPFDSLNLGGHVGDDMRAVALNRHRMAESVPHPVFLQQVHGTHAVQLSSSTPDGTVADAAFTSSPGLACTVMVADCLPVLFANGAGTMVAAAHAGWRGLAGTADRRGVVESVVECFRPPAHMGTRSVATEIIAWLGPCIGPDAFEVGPEVRAAFCDHDAQAAHAFKPGLGGKWMADLAGLARLRLKAQGVTQVFGNDSSRAWCTVSNPSRFFSYRRDQMGGGSGRFAACVWLDR